MAKLKTGRHTSALKQNRRSLKNAERNKDVKSNILTLAKKVEQACSKKDLPTAKSLLKEAFSAWDKAAKTNTIHWKKAASKKAQLAKKVAKIAS